MEKKGNKYQCSSKDHSDFKAISFCQKCEIYMCVNCDSIHSNLCPNHSIYSLNNINSDIFTGFCPIEKHHQIELDYFCKTHNQLCCAACIAKIKDNENGQHRDCEVYSLQKIKEEKKVELNNNIKFLENLGKKYNNKFEDVKEIYQDNLKEKEELKLYIKNTFDEIKNILDSREKQLLLEIDTQFNDIFSNKENLEQCEQLPEKISSCLNKGYEISKKWNDTQIKLNSLINECINIQKNLDEIKLINSNIKKFDINLNTQIVFNPEKAELNSFIEQIKSFGQIIQKKNHINYSFKPYPINITINEKRKFKLSGENGTKNILTKTGPDGWMGTICENILENSKIYRWRIKILKTQNNNIMVGIAPIDFDINISDYSNCGYYYYLKNSTLYSGPPYSYYGEKSNIISNKISDENDIVVIVNLKKRTLKFIINGEDNGVSYKDLPQDKPLAPAVNLFNQSDTIEICPF